MKFLRRFWSRLRARRQAAPQTFRGRGRWAGRFAAARGAVWRGLSAPFRGTAWLLRSSWSWLRRRNARLLLAGLPALLLGLAALVLGGAVLAGSGDSLTPAYRARYQAAMEAKDMPAARLCAERLAQLDGNDPEAVLGLARVLEAQGEGERAEMIVRGLAPEGRDGQAGHGPAHYWLAKRALASGRPSVQQARSAERHLSHALAGRPDWPEANAVMGELYAATGRLAQAEPFLRQGVAARPALRLLLARSHLARGELDLARARAGEAGEFFGKQLQANPADTAARLGAAELLAMLGRYAESADLLRQGAEVWNQQACRSALASVYATWFDSNTSATPADRVGLLERGLRDNPESLPLLERLSAMAGDATPAGDAGRAALRRLLAEGRATGGAHFALGLDAAKRNKPDEARAHWEQALAAAPHLAFAANNLAWVLTKAAKPDHEQALRLAESAVRQSPEDARFRSTRGHVLLALKRPKEALPDLQEGLKVYRNQAELHNALASAYEQMGNAEMAVEHRKLAGKLATPPQGRPVR